jgi:hypothetical protein
MLSSLKDGLRGDYEGEIAIPKYRRIQLADSKILEIPHCIPVT